MSRALLTLTEVPSGRAPLYQRIAQQMRNRIDAGTWGAGEQLKSEADLAADLRVARGTLRAALGVLIESGHIEQHHGLGTFVAHLAPSGVAAELTSLEVAIDSAGEPATTEVLSCIAVEHGDDGYELDRGFRARRLLRGSDGPISLIEDLVPATLAPELDAKDLTGRPFYAVLADDYDVHVARCEPTVGAVTATAELAGLLDLEAGQPLLHVLQLAFDDGDAILDITEAWVRSDRCQPTWAVVAR